jgi:hypothetical protein
MQTETQPTKTKTTGSAFTNRFAPGLIAGLTVGLLVGAFLSPLLDRGMPIARRPMRQPTNLSSVKASPSAQDDRNAPGAPGTTDQESPAGAAAAAPETNAATPSGG